MHLFYAHIAVNKVSFATKNLQVIESLQEHGISTLDMRCFLVKWKKLKNPHYLGD